MPRTQKDFQKLAGIRASEARALEKGGHQNGAYYLGGFSIECALKACLAKKTKRHDFPDKNYASKVFTHDLNELLRLAGLDAALEKDMKANPRLFKNWGVLKEWNIERRYDPSEARGSDMVIAVCSRDGLLKWIKQHW